MATPFLTGFTRAVVGALEARELVEIAPGAHEDVIAFVAERLGGASEGASLISALSAALLAAPGVEELFVDDGQLKRLVQDLDSTPATWVRG